MRADVGIDLGTSSVLIYVKGKGIILQEPAVVALDQNTGNFLAVGEDARQMLGRTPGNIVAVKPLKDGVISDYNITERMLKYFIKKAINKSFFRPRVIICVPSGITGVEKRAVIGASNNAGSFKTYIIEEPIAAAIGAGLDITEPDGNIVVDVGAGTTDVAVIALGGIVINQSIKIAGDDCDDAIIKYIRRKHNMVIGERSAETLKKEVGAAYEEKEIRVAEVKGRSLVTGLPMNVEITNREMSEALKDVVDEILNSVYAVLEKTPPELAADIGGKGIVMTGGGALLRGLDKLVEEKTGIKVTVAENPVECVAIGTGKALEWIEDLDTGTDF